ncbi:uncharacterized protein LOC116342734 [Contarinia nasturtii]|uniref:uncharacterized protein LOC116342734 n=1 Tax=Contarinia nasturtii TaxID=265458 RepID=UPI0012D399FB|nr:uncharacterized protein LOC116342734 [Contarinia nasturtii]
MDFSYGYSTAHMATNESDTVAKSPIAITSNKSSTINDSNGKEWKRAIPEAGYITLGTIRYGVRLGCLPSNCTHFRSSSLSTVDPISGTFSPSTLNAHSTMRSEHDQQPGNVNGLQKYIDNSSISSTSMPNVCDSDNSLSDVTSVNGSCCLNTTKCSLPWINKVDYPRPSDLPKNRIGFDRNQPTESVICANVSSQQPFSNYETNKFSDKSSNVNSTSVNSCVVDDISVVEIGENRQSFSTPICCYISANQIDNSHKSITSTEQKSSAHLDVVGKNKRKNRRQSPTHHQQQQQPQQQNECECSLQARKSNENATAKPCHTLENRKIINVGHKFNSNVINSIADQSRVDANRVNASDFQVNKSKFHCLDYEHSDQCCFCCYSDCKKGPRFKANYKCDEQSVECAQFQVNPSNFRCISSSDTNVNTSHLNNNCKLYKNQNNDQNSFCNSDTTTQTDILDPKKCLTHDNSYQNSTQFYVDHSIRANCNIQSDKCAKIQKRKTDPIPTPKQSHLNYLRRVQSINENCSDCIGQLDKRFIKQIKRLQSTEYCPKSSSHFPDNVRLAQDVQQSKLVCCSRNITAQKKTATLFMIGNDSSTLIGSIPKFKDKSELVHDDDLVDTCQNSVNNNNNNFKTQYNRTINGGSYKSIDSKIRLTSISPAKESHSKNTDCNQNINYKIRSGRTHKHLKSDCDENKRLNLVNKKQHKHEGVNGDNDNNDDVDDDYLCHLEKLNLANTTDSAATVEQVKQKITHISSTYPDDNGAITTHATAAPSLTTVEYESDKSKQNSEYTVIACTDQSAVSSSDQCNIFETNSDTVKSGNAHEFQCELNISDNENTDRNSNGNVLLDDNLVLNTKTENISNEECILFEHKPIVSSSAGQNRNFNRRASFDNSIEKDLTIFVNHRRTNSSGGEGYSFDRQSKLNRSYIDSISDRFRYIQNIDHRYAHYLTPNTQQNMEKRNNTLDRWQRLRFGRRSASNPPEDKKVSNHDLELASKRSSDKLERLREITELLKGPRNNAQNPVGKSEASSHHVPPIPPPRKPRISLHRNSGSIEKFIDTSASESSSPIISTKFDHSTENDPSYTTSIGQSLFHVPTPPPLPPPPSSSLINKLRPNTSLSNLESILKIRDKEKPMLPLLEENAHKETEKVTQTNRSASNTNSQKPFRSASFSQIDYSSGKYIRSALGALKASLSKAKSPPMSFSCKKERSESSSPEDAKLNECKDIWIPLKGPFDKRNDLNLDLIDASATANMILEEECEHSPISSKSETSMVEKSDWSPTSLPFNTINAAQMTVDSPRDESAAVQGVDNYFETVNPCLIPIPVFECSHLGDKWINTCDVDSENVNELSNKTLIVEPNDDDIPAFLEIQSEQMKSNVGVSSANNDIKKDEHSKRNSNVDELSDRLRQKAQSPTLDIDTLPAIAVTPGSSVSTVSGSSFEEIDNASTQSQSQQPRSDYASDYGVEVRKRYSNEDKSSDSNPSTSTSGTNSPKSHDEKRRIDKSKRRKGMYIQWATLDKHNKELNAVSWTVGDSSNDLCERIVPEIDSNGQPIWPIGAYHRKDHLQLEGPEKMRKNNLNSLSSLEPTSPESVFTSSRSHLDSTGKSPCVSCDETQPISASCDVFTPDSDCGRQPVWPQRGTTQTRRQSLSLQSSEEKDESLSLASPPPPSKPRSKIFLLRSDSISDNEMSDRTPPPRDRTSQSPAPDHDLKRYSKRPLRGPYGILLEAEMKKPAKQNYDGVLEELNRSESPYMLSAKQRDSNLLAYDDLVPPFTQRSISLGKSISSRKSSETENSLPIPVHCRAASTPAHMEAPRNEAVHAYHKRFPSCVETSSRKDTKRISTDSYGVRNADDRHSKRATSEIKDKITKRNASSPAAISLLNVGNEKSTHRHDDRGKSPMKHNQSLPLKASPELLAELLRGSSEKMTTSERERNKKMVHTDAYALPMAVQQFLDTRTHIVVELFNTEKSYVESLETVVKKYLNPLKSQENASLIEAQTVDEIFLMVPTILGIHQQFLDALRRRLESWEPLQRVGDAFVHVFSTSTVLETYTLFVNNVNRAKSAIRTASNHRPAFARFLENMAREHKGKLTLDNLLIKPVQKFPNYELMFQRLIKHTDKEHPDQQTLEEALKLVHDILLHLNCKEREALENDQREAALRELEGVIEGISDLVSSDRQFLSFDLVSMPHGVQGGRKERGFFLFNDLLIITSIKRRSGTIKKPSTTCPMSVASTLDTNKYKLLMKICIEDLDIIKAKDENVRKIMKEIEHLTEDCTKLQQVLDITLSLRCQHQTIEENVRELQKELQRQLSERQSNDSQLCLLELGLTQSGGQLQHITVVFPKSEKRTQWEKMFNEVKMKITAALDHHPIPEFIDKVSIRKTRAGLTFTCAAATLGAQKDVWVCNSDGYVGQVCVLSLSPEPTVTSCNGVCNARILCLASVPACNRKLNDSIASLSSNASSSPSRKSHGSSNLEKKTSNVSTKSIASNDSSGGTNSSSGNERDIQLDSSSSDDDSDDDTEPNQPLRRLNSTKASSTPQLSTSAPNSSNDHSQTVDDCSNDNQQHQPTMWLGTEDGCIHVYNCTDNIRTKKNKIKIQLVSAIYSILYLDNRVFVSLANGELVIYSRDQNGTWNTTSPQTILLGSATSPISKLLNVNGKLWCSVQGTIKVMNSSTQQIENQLQISSDIKPITNMAVYNNQVWISVQNSAQIKCFHSKSLALLFEVNLAPSVNKMLSNCDDIIRQHKAACLRVTSLLACKDLIWIGTSAGVILTCKTTGNATYNSGLDQPIVTGIPYGHTGHVRFITCVDHLGKLPNNNSSSDTVDSTSNKKKNSTNKSQASTSKSSEHSGLLIISGGDGFEEFRNSGSNPLSDIAGREDSTNHLLLWQV